MNIDPFIFLVFLLIIFVISYYFLFEGFTVEPSNRFSGIPQKEDPLTFVEDSEIDTFIQKISVLTNSKFQKEFDEKNIKMWVDSMIMKYGYFVLKISKIINDPDSNTIDIPMFISKIENNLIVRRIILVMYKSGTIKDIIVPENISKLEKVEILPSFSTSSFMNDNIEYKQISSGGIHGIQNDTIDNIILTPELFKRAEDYREKVKLLEEKYMCYGIPEFQKIPTKEQCELFDGKWDRPVKDPSECPFYEYIKAPVNNGRCKLPMGVKPIGFRFYSGDPLCYGCTITNGIGPCCNEQKNPKYVFGK